MGILEKIAEIEKEIARTQKNKGVLLLYLELTTQQLMSDNYPPPSH